MVDKIFSDRKYRGKIVLYVVLKFAYSGLLLLPPYCYLLFLDEIIIGQRLERLIFILGAYIVVFMAKTAMTTWSKQVYNRIFPEIEAGCKMKILEKYSRLPLFDIQNYTAGELHERIHKDTENVSQYYLKKIDIGIGFVNILATAVILVRLNVVMAVVSFLLLPLSYWITQYIRGKSNVEYKKKRQAQGKYNDFMINSLFFWKEIKSGRLEKKQNRQFEAYWDEIGTAFIRSHLCWFMNRTFLAFKDVFLTKMGLYLMGGILVIYGMGSVPALLAFMEYYAGFADRLLEVTDMVVWLGGQEESVKRVNEILGLPLNDVRKDMGHFKSLVVRNVEFSYPVAEKKILDSFSLEVRNGDSVAVMGESGCGKSTLVKIMAGCLKPQKGVVLWNGYAMEDIDENTLYSKAGFLMQDVGLFNLTIRENMQFGKKDADEREMEEACRRANILDFIQELPLGFETVIGENGIRLSGGQRQRLQIARLFLQDPEVIVFDEATSALDYGNESKILNLLLDHMQGKTFIMVTHRETAVARCDRVVEIGS